MACKEEAWSVRREMVREKEERHEGERSSVREKKVVKGQEERCEGERGGARVI